MSGYQIASILVIESSIEDQALMRHFFENSSLCNRLDFAQTAAEGRINMHSCDYDMVFIDAHLPDANGLDYAAEISQQHPDKQIVLLSGSDDKDQLQKAADAGVFGYILKPLTQQVLSQLVAHSPLLYMALVVDYPRISRI